MSNLLTKIGLVVDEAADLPKEIIEKYQIEVVPLKMEWPEIEGLSGENIFQKMREAEKQGIKSFGKTSQPSLKDFLETFKKQFEKFEKILCITITSKLSGTYNSALQAKNFLKPEEKERVFIVDSLNGSCGQGLLSLKAIDLINRKKNKIREIVKELEKIVPQVHLIAMLKDPKWLEASGRISAILSNWLRKMAKIGVRPLIGVKKGKVVAIGIRTGAKDIPTALFKELEVKTRNFRKQGQRIQVAITHADDLEGAKKLKEMIEEKLKGVEVIFINLIDTVIGTIAGPDTLALAWVSA